MVKYINKLMFTMGGGINYFLGNYKKNSVNRTTKISLKGLSLCSFFSYNYVEFYIIVLM